MKRVTKRFALCLKNTGNEASLILGKVYRVVPDARAGKDDLVRIVDESGEDYLFHKTLLGIFVSSCFRGVLVSCLRGESS